MIVADTILIAYFITATAAGYGKLADAVYQKDPRWFGTALRRAFPKLAVSMSDFVAG